MGQPAAPPGGPLADGPGWVMWRRSVEGMGTCLSSTRAGRQESMGLPRKLDEELLLGYVV
ncbi:hypothetical protein E2C01_081987 [Portunus trituberculatus]|uniref:Uncharacterized protein n=1 Tax=Portunus trituberculatus TaxID=210409 RepID=A0A5B7IZL0_PORTR|nr:hypothetical protein [Portunus trituberculatus]